MGYSIYLTLTGKRQGLISKGCSTYDSIGNKYQSGHMDQTYVYSVEHDFGREQNIIHQPVILTKPIDESSPLLSLAISENEPLDGLLEFYRTSMNGSQEKFYSMEIREAFLANLSLKYPNSLTHTGAQPFEIISLTYKTIIWQHHIAGTSGFSVWEDRIY